MTEPAIDGGRFTNPAARLLEAAAQVLERGGHQRDSLGRIDRVDSPHCALGAFLTAYRVMDDPFCDPCDPCDPYDPYDVGEDADLALRRELALRFDNDDLTEVNDDPTYRMGQKRWAALFRKVAAEIEDAA